MKLYLSSYRIPEPDKLFRLVGKKPGDITLAIIPNAKDYYAKRAKDYKINDIVAYQQARGIINQTVVDLLDYRSSEKLREELSRYDIIWAVGGNTFCLRQAMQRSGFDEIIRPLLDSGIVYGGDSAGAVVAGTSLRGIETADVPEFAENVIYDGLGIIPYVIIPHADNDFFTEANEKTRALHKDNELIELKDSQAVIFHGDSKSVITAPESEL